MHNLLGVSMPFEDPALVLVTVFFSLLRAVPVLWDGRRYVGGLTPDRAPEA